MSEWGRVLLLYLLWLVALWSISSWAAVSKVTHCDSDTRKSDTKRWLMMRSDLSFLLAVTTDHKTGSQDHRKGS